MVFDYFKALHLIFMVAWFAGLFYLPRLYIYYVEAEDKAPDAKKVLQDQFLIMIRRLWHIITWPAMILTVVFGTGMLVVNTTFLKMDYMHVKLGMVFLLVLYHVFSYTIYLKMKKGQPVMSSFKLRLWNEVATLLLFGIIFVIVLRDSLTWMIGVGGLVGLAIVLMVAVQLYKRSRERNSD